MLFNIGPYGNSNGGNPFSEKEFVQHGPITGIRCLYDEWLGRQVFDDPLNTSTDIDCCNAVNITMNMLKIILLQQSKVFSSIDYVAHIKYERKDKF